MTRSGRNVLSGLQEFRQFLVKQQSELSATPVLLIESPAESRLSMGGTKTRQGGKPSELFQHVQFFCSSVGLRTATNHPSSGHFPLVADISSTLEFAKRTGAGTIVGVGGSGAVELAKAVSQEIEDFEQLILVPEDYGTTLFASAAHGLVMDPKEMVLLPHPSKRAIPREVQSHIVLSDLATPAKEDTALSRSTAYAGLVLALDNLYRGCENEDETLSMINLASDLIDKLNGDQGRQKEDEEKLQVLMMGTGSSMSFGLSANDRVIRSVPLALSSSLLASTFPDYDFIGFVSCLLPGVLSTLVGTKHNDLAMELSSRFLYRCPRIAKSSGDDLDLRALLSDVHSNMALWDCDDADDAALKEVLRTSLDL